MHTFWAFFLRHPAVFRKWPNDAASRDVEEFLDALVPADAELVKARLVDRTLLSRGRTQYPTPTRISMELSVSPPSPARRASARANASYTPREGRFPADGWPRRADPPTRTSLSRHPSLTPQRRLALSGPHRTQSSPRPKACAQSEASPRSSTISPALIASTARSTSPTAVNARQPVPQLRLIDPVLGPAALEPRPGLRDAILHGLRGIDRPSAPARIPSGRASRMTFVSTSTVPRCRAMTLHRLGRFRDTLHREQIREIVDTRLEQCRGPAHRDEALPDRKPENLH